MLGSFQNLYPTSCLLTELVQIYHGKYIVKASLQIEGVTRTTGMAAAEILEEAEDRARERALEVFAIADGSRQQPVTQANTRKIATPSVNISPINDSASKNDALVNDAIDAIPSEMVAKGIATPTTIPVTAKTATTPQVIPEIPVTTTSTASSINNSTNIQANTVETEEKLEEQLDPKSHVTSTDKLQEPDAPEPEVKPEIKPGLVSSLELEEAIPADSEANAPAPRKSTSSTKTKTGATSKQLNQDSPNLHQDLSQDKHEISTPVTQSEPLFDISIESSAVINEQSLTPTGNSTTEPELPFSGSNAATTNVMPFTPRDYNPPQEIEIPLPPVPEPTPTTTTSKRKRQANPKIIPTTSPKLVWKCSVCAGQSNKAKITYSRLMAKNHATYSNPTSYAVFANT